MLVATFYNATLYAPATSLTRDRRIFTIDSLIASYEVSDFQFSRFARSVTGEYALYTSDVRGCNVVELAQRLCLQPRGAIALIKSDKTQYFVVLTYLVDYLSFQSVNRDILNLNSTEIGELRSGTGLNRLYDNSRAIMFGHPDAQSPVLLNDQGASLLSWHVGTSNPVPYTETVL